MPRLRPLLTATLLALALGLAACDSGRVGDSGDSGPLANASVDGSGRDPSGAPDAPFDRALGDRAGEGPGGDGAPLADAAPSDGPLADATDGAPAPANLRIAVLSDLNGSYGSTTYEENVHRAVASLTSGPLRPDLVLITGDMVAGQQAGLDYRAMWDGFHAAVSDPLALAGIPVAVTPGNHDASGYASFAGEREIFVDEWVQPGRVPAVDFLDDSAYPLRYSFTYGGVLFISLDDTTIGPLSGEQRAWLEAQLEAGRAYPVKIVYGHVPLRPFTVGRENEILADDELEALLAREGVSALVTGHHHGYYPGVSGGVRQVSTPCLGAGPRALVGTDTASPRGLLLLDVVDGVLARVEALRAPDFSAPIERAGLPAELVSGPHRVVRDDLAGF